MCQQVCYLLLLTTALVENRINKNHVAYLWAHLNSLHQFYTFDLNIKHLMLTLFKRSLLTVERPEGTERMYVPSFLGQVWGHSLLKGFPGWHRPPQSP